MAHRNICGYTGFLSAEGDKALHFENILKSDGSQALRQFGENLRTYRTHLVGCSQDEMAQRIGISRSTYLRMEAGDPRIPIGCWIGAWRRLYLDRENDLSLLTGLLALLDPTEPLARDQMQQAHKDLCRRREGDIAADIEHDIQAGMAAALAFCRDKETGVIPDRLAPGEEEDTAIDDPDENPLEDLPDLDEVGEGLIGEEPCSLTRRGLRLQEIARVASAPRVPLSPSPDETP